MAKSKNRKPGIYEIRNMITGFVYIGASINVESRMKNHKWLLGRGEHSNRLLQDAYNKDSAEAFSFSILEIVADPIMIGDRERYWIEQYENTYNLLLGYSGDPGKTKIFSEERSIAISQRNKERWSDPQFKERTRAAISEAKKGVSRGPHSNKTRARIGEANRARAHLQVGVPLSQETREKMSKTRTGMTRTPEARAKISTAMMGNSNKRKSQ